jgi:hypothetical protein
MICALDDEHEFLGMREVGDEERVHWVKKGACQDNESMPKVDASLMWDMSI